MSTELTQGGSQTLTAVPDVTDDLQLVAFNAEQMKAAQASMSAWFAGKVAILRKDEEELAEAYETAMRNNWKSDAIRKQLNILSRRIAFYDKCRVASDAGYCVVPNMPCDIFAVRVKSERKGLGVYEDWQRPSVSSDSPPVGVGTYVGDTPKQRRYATKDYANDPNKTVIKVEAWSQDEVDFPVSVRRPEIMSETARAMALKCFDDVAVVPSRRRKGDPLVLGLINGPNKLVTFLIAWYVDTKAL